MITNRALFSGGCHASVADERHHPESCPEAVQSSVRSSLSGAQLLHQHPGVRRASKPQRTPGVRDLEGLLLHRTPPPGSRRYSPARTPPPPSPLSLLGLHQRVSFCLQARQVKRGSTTVSFSDLTQVGRIVTKETS